MQDLYGISSLLSLHDVMFAQNLGANSATASDEELETACHLCNAGILASSLMERNHPLALLPECFRSQFPSPHVNRRIDMHDVLQKPVGERQIIRQNPLS